MATREVIDLTASDDHEVIEIASDDDGPGPSRQRSQANGDNIRAETAQGTNGEAEKPRKSRRRIDRKKRRKETVVGEAKEEVMEEGEVSGEVSMEISQENTDIEDGRRENRRSAKRKLEHVDRTLLDRLENVNGTAKSKQASPSKPKKKKSKKRKREDDGPSGTIATGSDPLAATPFFVDDKPTEIPDVAKPSTAVTSTATSSAANGQPNDASALLLPTHVSVLDFDGGAPVQIIAPTAIDSEDDDYIQYLDYDDDRRAGVVRYFDDLKEIEEAKAAKASRVVCKLCGAEGQHTTRQCRVLICLTCGARDEHSTRGCPISKSCYNCGMKGHINKDCPNRKAVKGFMGAGYEDCDRCGSRFHKTNQCPTLWRMYEYVDDAERLRILKEREEKRDLDIGEGGEGYIAPEDWCYNCGGCGHLGDDCQVTSHNNDIPQEPSAFSSYNVNAGPFADAERPAQQQPSRAAQYASLADKAWGDGYGSRIPLNVGREGKKKEKQRLAQRLEETNDDADDWFANRGGSSRAGLSNSRNGQNGSSSNQTQRNGKSDGKKKMSFGNLGRDEGRYGGRDRDRDGGRRDRDRYRSYDDDLPQPSRETDSIQIRGAASRRSDREDRDGKRGGGSRKESLYERMGGDRGRYDDHYDRRDRDRKRDRERSPARGPRYKGGYAR